MLGEVRRIAASGKAPGILSSDEAVLTASLDAGAQFVAVGLDTVMLKAAAQATVNKWIKK